MRIIKRDFKETYLSYFDVELDHRFGTTWIKFIVESTAKTTRRTNYEKSETRWSRCP